MRTRALRVPHNAPLSPGLGLSQWCCQIRRRDDRASSAQCALTTTAETWFEVPLYTVSDATRIVAVDRVPASALATWAKEYVRRGAGRADVTGEPVITWWPTARSQDPSIPFVGLAEALVLAVVRQTGCQCAAPSPGACPPPEGDRRGVRSGLSAALHGRRRAALRLGPDGCRVGEG